MTALAIVVAAMALLWLGARVLATKRNAAGIQTTVASRTAQLGRLATRSAGRKAALRMKQLLSGRARREALKAAHTIKSADEAVAMMGQMKGVFMKIGQVVSFANESLPAEARERLQTLQQDAPPMAFSLVREVLEAELGAPLDARFSYIDEVPLAAASIGQVHRARLREGGVEVALKIQYPGVADAIRSDLKFTKGLARLISAVHKNADSMAMVAELRARLEDELDYTREAANQQLFADIWRGHPLIRVPDVYLQHTTPRVLCQDYVDGLGFYDFLEVANAEEKRVAVHVLNDFVFDSMHLHRVFNGDPHPGNYLFHDDGGITFLDFGCVKRFEEGFLAEVRGLNRAIIAGDHGGFDRHVHALQLVLPGRPYDHDFVWDFFQYHAAPFRDDAVFTFTSDYLKRAATVMRPGNLRRLNLPPDLIFFNRITFGLNAIFQRLGAADNFHQWYRRYTHPEDKVPPAVARLGVQLPSRFVATGSALVASAASPTPPVRVS